MYPRLYRWTEPHPGFCPDGPHTSLLRRPGSPSRPLPGPRSWARRATSSLEEAVRVMLLCCVVLWYVLICYDMLRYVGPGLRCGTVRYGTIGYDTIRYVCFQLGGPIRASKFRQGPRSVDASISLYSSTPPPRQPPSSSSSSVAPGMQKSNGRQGRRMPRVSGVREQTNAQAVAL